jgi:hypothetical protein
MQVSVGDGPTRAALRRVAGIAGALDLEHDAA